MTSYYARFAPFLKPYLPRMVLAVLLVMGVALVNLTLVRLAGIAWDLIAVKRDLSAMTTTLGVLLALVAVQGLLSMGHSYLTSWVSEGVMAAFRTSLFNHLQGLSLDFFTKRRTGELLSRIMNDVSVIQTTLTEIPVDAAKHAVTFIGGIAFLVVMNWKLCLLILTILPALVLVARLFGRRLKSLSTTIQDQTASLTTLTEEVVSGIRMVKSFVQTSREQARFAEKVLTVFQLKLRRAAILAVFVPTIT
ncbi:MAG: ABC transporter transmembrane domain-containing protein, partial [Nitrospirales bacterium]